MKIIVIGAGGRLGRQVLTEAVRAGHETMAFVRSKARLRSAIGEQLISRVAVVEGDVLEKEALRAAMAGCDAAVQAAGYIGSTPEEGRQLQALVAAAVEAADECLVGARRLWVMGGAGALDLPGRRGVMLVDIPGFPPRYMTHRRNFDFLSQPRFDSLDWSFACPGAMVDAGPAAPAAAARAAAARLAAAPRAASISVDELPTALPFWAAALPTPLLLPALAAIRGQLVGPSYAEVAASMVAHLAPGGPLRHHRVGFASKAS